jgi:hypothetical protein
MSRSFYVWFVAAGIAAAGITLYFVNPAEQRCLPPCTFYYMTGLYCPGCGTTRAVHQLLHGHLAAAMALNPLMLASLPVMAVLLVRPRFAAKPWVAWTAFVVVVAFGILRNIPCQPFLILAPHNY